MIQLTIGWVENRDVLALGVADQETGYISTSIISKQDLKDNSSEQLCRLMIVKLNEGIRALDDSLESKLT